MKFFKHIFIRHRLIAISILAILAVVVLTRVFASTPYTPGQTLNPAEGPGDSFVQTQWTNSGNDIYSTNSGNIGIGTATPSQILDVLKDQNASTSVYIRNPGTGNKAGSEVRLASNLGDSGLFRAVGTGNSNLQLAGGVVLSSAGNNLVIANESLSPIIFDVGGLETTYEKMRIDGNGNVGIGTASPDSTLQIGESATPATFAYIDGNQGANKVLTSNASGVANWADSVPYTKYVALLTQSGTDAPIATVLENTLGGTVVWTRNGLGDYYGTLAGAFPAGKTFVLPGSTWMSADTRIQVGRLSDNVVEVLTFGNLGFTGAVDDELIDTAIEIRVYP